MRSRVLVVVGLVVGALAQACGPGPSACSLVGGLEGVMVQLAPAVLVGARQITTEVCDDRGCASHSQALRGVPSQSPTPEGRVVANDFDDLGRTFDPGPVTVTVVLRGPDGAPVASRREVVRLTATYPNGRECDKTGFVGGWVRLRSGDRV